MRKQKPLTGENPIFKNKFDRIKAEQALERARWNLIESNRILAEGAKELKKMMEKLKNENSAKKDPCIGCRVYSECKIYRGLDFKTSSQCSRIFGRRFFKKDYSANVPEMRISEDQNDWMGRLEEYIQCRTKYDSCIEGMAKTSDYIKYIEQWSWATLAEIFDEHKN